MRLPRDLSGEELLKRVRKLGYEPTRQSGSHVRLTCRGDDDEHHITIPMHSPLRVGTLNAILSDIAEHLSISKDDIIQRLS